MPPLYGHNKPITAVGTGANTREDLAASPIAWRYQLEVYSVNP